MSETDKQLADRVLQALTTARYIHPGPAFRQVGTLREDVGSGGNVERERADAWLAICALHDALAGKARGGDMDSRWNRAIEKVEAWHASIKAAAPQPRLGTPTAAATSPGPGTP